VYLEETERELNLGALLGEATRVAQLV
jgi:hypothetical protein